MNEGILLVDKKTGLTSFDLVARIRKTLKTKKVGHAGTLDPLASGLMVLLVGRYTKLSDYLTSQSKSYKAVVCFGQSTSTDDAEGEIVEQKDPQNINEQDLLEAIESFKGTQMQTPPIYSAISIGGERAYKKARRNETFTMAEREITVHKIELISWDLPYATIEIHSSKGTYIRSIARDLGKKLNIPAYLNQLQRTSCGDYELAKAISTESLADYDVVSSHLKNNINDVLGIKKVLLDEKTALALKQGKKPLASLNMLEDETFLTYFYEEPVALAKYDQGRLVSVRGF